MDAHSAAPGATSAAAGEKVAQERAKASERFVMGVAFFCVGIGCGWFPSDAIINLCLNEASLGGIWIARVVLIGSTVGIIEAGIFMMYVVVIARPFSFRFMQSVPTVLIGICVAELLVLAGFWQVAAPHHPVVVISAILGTLVSQTTALLVLPMIATYYGGWLVAPFRAGTDVSAVVTAFLGEAQNPSGSHNVIPSWVLLVCYAGAAMASIFSWVMIVRLGTGLRAEAFADAKPATPASAAAGNLEAASSNGIDEQSKRSTPALWTWAGVVDAMRRRLSVMRCPRQLLVPVLVGALVDVVQWGFIASIADIGALMTDPDGCDGTRGKWVARTSFTANRALVPLGSVISTLAPCPRGLFKMLALVQTVAAFLMITAATGVFRGLWTTEGGQYAYTVCYNLVGLLEGYLLTMAYRYVGDAKDIPAPARQSASSMLSWLSVFSVCVSGILSGELVNSGTLRCTPPAV